MKKHLTINAIISVFCYFLVAISEKTLDISIFSDGGAFALSCLIFALNATYYTNRYLDGEFTRKAF